MVTDFICRSHDPENRDQCRQAHCGGDFCARFRSCAGTQENRTLIESQVYEPKYRSLV